MPFVSPLWALLTFLGWILVLGGLIALGIWLVQRVWPSVGGLTAMVPEDPLRIAQLRYARGEISREEYERIREELTRASRQ
jgi:putative membrane protein